MKKGEMEAFGHFLRSREAFKLGTAVRVYQRKKAQRGFKDDVFLEEMHSLKARKQFSPLLACQEIYRGLTVAPHGDGFFLKDSRIQKMIFRVGQMPSS